MSNPDAKLAFKAAVEARDPAAVRSCLASDVRFYPPLRFTPLGFPPDRGGSGYAARAVTLATAS
jgi:hypothetical protein